MRGAEQRGVYRSRSSQSACLSVPHMASGCLQEPDLHRNTRWRDTLFYEDFHLQDVLKKYQALYQDNNQANLVLSYICTDEETTKYGILEVDENYRIKAIKEKPLAIDTASRQACPCFYMFSNHTLPCVETFLNEKKDAPIDERDAPGHFLSWLVTRKPVYFYSISGRFDVGNLQSYLLCDKYFQEKITKLNYLH